VAALVPATPIPYAANTAIYAGIGNVRGWSIRATAATTVVRLRDGSVSGAILGEIALTTSGTSDTAMDPAGVHFSTGVYAELVSGTAEGVVYIS
jgi:hypothetical protein